MESLRSSLRVVPDPDSAQVRAEAWAAASARADEADWCIDAEATIAGASEQPDADASAISASERRAIHLTRQRIRAQAILADPPEADATRRERTRRATITVASAALHLIGFALLANAVADLQPNQRPATHEHLFEARAIVPIEPEPIPEIAAPEQAEVATRPAPSEPSRTKPTRKPKPHDHAEPSADTSQAEPAPYEMRGFELSSAGELAAGNPGGEAWGRPGGSGKGSGSGEGGDAKPAIAKPDVAAKPRGGLLEPEYPAELERQGVEGSVLVKVWIDEHGHVIKAEVVESSGEEAFDHNALMTAQRQEWTAASVAGEAVASTRRYRVNFRLR